MIDAAESAFRSQRKLFGGEVLLTLANLKGIAAVSWLAREDQYYWRRIGTASGIFEKSAFNHSRNFDQRCRPETLRTAMATAFF